MPAASLQPPPLKREAVLALSPEPRPPRAFSRPERSLGPRATTNVLLVWSGTLHALGLLLIGVVMLARRVKLVAACPDGEPSRSSLGGLGTLTNNGCRAVEFTKNDGIQRFKLMNDSTPTNGTQITVFALTKL